MFTYTIRKQVKSNTSFSYHFWYILCTICFVFVAKRNSLRWYLTTHFIQKCDKSCENDPRSLQYSLIFIKWQYENGTGVSFSVNFASKVSSLPKKNMKNNKKAWFISIKFWHNRQMAINPFLTMNSPDQ